MRIEGLGPPTGDDAAFLDAVVDVMKTTYARFGGSRPIGFIETGGAEPAVRMIHAPPIGGEAEKRLFVDLLRHQSIRQASPRAAIAMEAWTIIDKSEKIMREAMALIEQGRSIREHPACGEAVTITVESEAGTSLVELVMKRHSDTMVELIRQGPGIFVPAGDPDRIEGQMAGFHVRLSDRVRPEVIGWTVQMDRVWDAVASQINDDDIPLTRPD